MMTLRHTWFRVALTATMISALGCDEDPERDPDAGEEQPLDAGPADAAFDGARGDGSVDARPPAEDARVAPDSAALSDGGKLVEKVCPGPQYLYDETLPELRDCTTIGGSLSVTSALIDIELPELVVIEGFLTVWDNPAAKTVRFPKLQRVGGYLDVSFNLSLQSISMPALRSVNDRDVNAVHDVAIKDNGMLPPCQAEEIRDQLKSSGYTGSIGVSNNGGTCSP
jgi:hypothetical protein